MTEGKFYFISDDYYTRFKDCGLLGNKEIVAGKPHGRPCYFVFCDNRTGLYWMVPISSRVEKYSAIYDKNIKKYGRCDFIVFGDVLGYRKAFLVQNMCPISLRYLSETYLDRYDSPVSVESNLDKEITAQAKKVLALTRKGIKLVFSDILRIEAELLKDR